MAKETKAERIEREAQEESLRIAKEEQDYISNMMSIFERATRVNFEITVSEECFVATDRDDRDEEHYVPPVYSVFAQTKLDDLDWSIRYKETAIEEMNRKYMLKQAALNKLSKEEKEVLGIT